MSSSSTWFIYLVRCRDGSLYTGISTDVEARIKRHNTGKGAAYTRSRTPVVLVWYKACANESHARKQEAFIKSWNKQKKEQFIKMPKSYLDSKSLGQTG